MTINVLDRSNYFKGMLLLVGKDKNVSENERLMMQDLGKILGFDKKFYNTALDEILDNEYISHDPPIFSDKTFAEAFLLDSIKLATIDKKLCLSEIKWLYLIAKVNSISDSWLRTQFEKFKEAPSFEHRFEIASYLESVRN